MTHSESQHETPVNLLGCTRLTVTVDQRVIDDDHSFQQWKLDDEHGMAQVQLKAGKTHFRHDGADPYVFEGVRWFPNVTEDYMGATVDLHRLGDREHIATHLTTGEFTVRDLVDGLNQGDLEPVGENRA